MSGRAGLGRSLNTRVLGKIKHFPNAIRSDARDFSRTDYQLSIQHWQINAMSANSV